MGGSGRVGEAGRAHHSGWQPPGPAGAAQTRLAASCSPLPAANSTLSDGTAVRLPSLLLPLCHPTAAGSKRTLSDGEAVCLLAGRGAGGQAGQPDLALKRGGGKHARQLAGGPLHVKVPVGGGRQLAIHLACRVGWARGAGRWGGGRGFSWGGAAVVPASSAPVPSRC